MGGEENKIVVGIDVGIDGAFCVTDGKFAEFYNMPLRQASKNKMEPDFTGIANLIEDIILSHGDGLHFYLERAAPFAMGSIHSFNYGRGFAALEIALLLAGVSVTYVESAKWTKTMHEGISADLKAKAKSIVAVQRLYPKLSKLISLSPKSKKMHEGQMDALLIAGYGLRALK